MHLEDLEQRWQKKSQEAFHTLAQWQKEHPKATLAEIEAAIDAQLDQVRARIIEEIVQAERETTQQGPRSCPQCGTRMLANLIHPNIVHILDFGVDDRTPYLIMDYAPGGTLCTRHPKGTRLPLSTVVL